MKELIGFVNNKFPGGIVIGIPPGKVVKFVTEGVFKLGQKVWVAYDFTKKSVVSVRSTPAQEGSSPNNPPEPMSFGCHIEDTHPIVEDEEYLDVEDETTPDTDVAEEY